MSIGVLKIAMGLLFAILVSVAAMIVFKSRPALAHPGTWSPRGKLPFSFSRSKAATATSAPRSAQQLRRRGLVARTADELELARLATQQLQFDLQAPGYFPAIEAWLEQIFDTLLDRHLTLAAYKALLEMQAETASDRLQQIRDGDAAVIDKEAHLGLVIEAEDAITAIRWCQDWAEAQAGEGAMRHAPR